jgi:primosomal protein N' (replication factor Y)
MLVPEIALTPQLEGRVAARFPDAHVVCANSGMADAARARGFLDAQAGRADIVLGTRLSVFMPLPRLRLIVVDEEHDASFKQQEGLRYSARDVAIWRAHQRTSRSCSVPPRPRWKPSIMPHGALSACSNCPSAPWPRTMPSVVRVDTRREKLQEGLSAGTARSLPCASSAASKAWSSSTGAAMRRCWPARPAAGSRAAGAAPPTWCCIWPTSACAATTAASRPHVPRACPDCGNVDLLPFGRGTQRLEAMLGERFPQARVLRIDRDSASTPKKWQALLATIHAGGPTSWSAPRCWPRATISRADPGRRGRRRCRPVRRRFPRSRNGCSRS